MKAILCQQYGPPEQLVLTERPSPKAGKGQVVIQVEACGVNFPDTLMIEGKYQFKPSFPFSPGGEVSGTVIDVGEGVEHLRVGDAVFSLTGHGGFAEEVVANAATKLPIPAGWPNGSIDFVTAASTMYTYGTSYHALKDRANLKAGETLLVMGAAGGVGLAAVQLGVLMGARVIAAASSEEKLAVCRAMGAAETINYTTENLRDRIRDCLKFRIVESLFEPSSVESSLPILSLSARNQRLIDVDGSARQRFALRSSVWAATQMF